MTNNTLYPSLAPIKRWTVEHERIVAMHIGGMDNKEIARISSKTKKISEVRVSQIISDPQARKTIYEAIMKVRSQMMENLDGGLAVLADLGLKRIKETMDWEFVPGSNGKHHQDRLALDIIKLLKGDGIQGEEAPPLNEELFNRLTEALEDSNAAEGLIREATYVEVTEVVEDE